MLKSFYLQYPQCKQSAEAKHVDQPLKNERCCFTSLLELPWIYVPFLMVLDMCKDIVSFCVFQRIGMIVVYRCVTCTRLF